MGEFQEEEEEEGGKGERKKKKKKLLELSTITFHKQKQRMIIITPFSDCN